VFGISTTEFLVILAVALIIVGPSKLPEMAKTLGRILGELKKATRDIKDSFEADENLSEVKRTFDQAVAEGMSAVQDKGVLKAEEASPGGAADSPDGQTGEVLTEAPAEPAGLEAELTGEASIEALAEEAGLEAELTGEASTEALAEAAELEVEMERAAESGAEAVNGAGPESKEPGPA